MKLYATITSERGKEISKSGNEFIAINLYNEARICYGSIEVLPDDKSATVWVRVHGEKHFIVDPKELSKM